MPQPLNLRIQRAEVVDAPECCFQAAPVPEAAVLHCPGSGLIGKAEEKTTISFPPQGSCGHYETPFGYAGGASFGEDSRVAGLLNQTWTASGTC